MAAGEYPIYAEEGVERKFTVTLVDPTDTVIDLRETTIKLFIRKKFGDCGVILESELIKTDAEHGEFTFLIPADCFVGLIKNPRGPNHKENFVYDVVTFKEGESPVRWLQGVITVGPKVGDYE